MPIQEILVCSACGKNTEDGLALMPSGRNFKRHTGIDGQRCTGGQPQTQEPEQVEIAPTSKTTKVECVECGELYPAVKTPGKVRKHVQPGTQNVCQQRDDFVEPCPKCDARFKLHKMHLPIHKDFSVGTRCPGSGKTLADAAALQKSAPPLREGELPRQRKERDGNPLAKLSPLDRSKYKASRLGEELKPLGWRFRVVAGTADQDADQATLVLRRGRGASQEEMQISWWAGACYGGEGRITHTYRDRTVAVRNANGIRQQAQTTPEAVAAGHARVSTRKASGPRKKRTPSEMREVMPFDPQTADDEAILKAVLGHTVKWERGLDGKIEDDVVKSSPIIKTTKSGRQLTFQGLNTTRTINVSKLVSVS